MNLAGKIESLLFVSPRPLSLRKLADLTASEVSVVEQAIADLTQRYNRQDQGINILRHGSAVQMVTSPLSSQLVTSFLKEEQAGELTRPALETLTIIAYRGPISKIQLDTIRGVNCALILRHLMVKGLVEAKPHRDKYQTTYQVAIDFVRFLGLNQIADLPDYQRLNHDENLEHLLNPPPPVATDETGAKSTAQPP
ncbi:MAG: SMC-Scp complex subunit ScpB [Candidatus Kerfeldbacteria bacterium]|nr:SMC-Scp complex subunit ScpB [Candidatus Kerfeldbacteria bacterium]